jgi:hypothetical protein
MTTPPFLAGDTSLDVLKAPLKPSWGSHAVRGSSGMPIRTVLLAHPARPYCRTPCTYIHSSAHAVPWDWVVWLRANKRVPRPREEGGQRN